MYLYIDARLLAGPGPHGGGMDPDGGDGKIFTIIYLFIYLNIYKHMHG